MSKLKRIHINKHTIAKNHKQDLNEPVIGVEESGKPKRYGHEVIIDGPSQVVYHPDKPLKCGARVWIETRADVTVIIIEGD
jgi:hypothetical protein